MLVGVVGMTTTIKVGEWGKNIGKSQNAMKLILEIQSHFFKKNGDHFYTLVNFLDSEKKGFFAAFVCMPFTFMDDIYISCLFNFVY